MASLPYPRQSGKSGLKSRKVGSLPNLDIPERLQYHALKHIRINTENLSVLPKFSTKQGTAARGFYCYTLP